MIFSRWVIVTLAGFLVILPLAAEAASPTDRLRPAVEEVVRILEDPSLKPKSMAAEREARVRAAVVDLFDFPEMARRTLGIHWRSLSEPQQEEFVRLFRALLEHTYLPKIALYQGERVRFVGEAVDGDLATVQTFVITRDRKEAPVAYRLRQRDGQWLVYDISVEGISLTSNYRSQFNEIIQRGGYKELVRRIELKLIASPDTADRQSSPRRK